MSGIQAAGESRMLFFLHSSVIGCTETPTTQRGSRNFSTCEGSGLQLSQVCNNVLRREMKSKKRERNGEKEEAGIQDVNLFTDWAKSVLRLLFSLTATESWLETQHQPRH